MTRWGRLIALAAHAGASAAVFIASWWVWRETGLPCTMETAEILLCNPDSGLSSWIRLDIIGQCGLNAGIALALTGGNDGMFFLQERRERKRETARADLAEAERQKAEAERQKAEAELRKVEAELQLAEARQQIAELNAGITVVEWLRNLTDEQKDAIYEGPVVIGDIAWNRIGGQDIIGRRTENGWLLENFPDLPSAGLSNGQPGTAS